MEATERVLARRADAGVLLQQDAGVPSDDGAALLGALLVGATLAAKPKFE